jgi:hypothetical protein
LIQVENTKRRLDEIEETIDPVLLKEMQAKLVRKGGEKIKC